MPQVKELLKFRLDKIYSYPSQDPSSPPVVCSVNRILIEEETLDKLLERISNWMNRTGITFCDFQENCYLLDNIQYSILCCIIDPSGPLEKTDLDLISDFMRARSK